MLTRSQTHTFDDSDGHAVVRVRRLQGGELKVDVDRYGMSARSIIDLIEALCAAIREYAPQEDHLLQAVLDKHHQTASEGCSDSL